MYATDTNVLKTTAVPLTGHFVHGVRLVMKKAHATEGVLGGHALYGVRSFKVMAPQMRAVLEPCGSVLRAATVQTLSLLHSMPFSCVALHAMP